VFSLYIKSLPPYLSLSLSQNMVKKWHKSTQQNCKFDPALYNC
jgi:hypothetical protein